MTDAVLSPGTVVSDTYDVENIIGRGAMGEVYSALHRRLPGLRVAIKVMTGQTLGADRLMRFRREAEIAAKLSHPNIVQIIDYNTLPTGQPYLVMEFLRGESLHARLKRGPLKLEALKKMVREVGAALAAAHEAGVVHRDLKPENIYLVPTPTGDQAKVLDFGISKMNDGALVQTSDSMIIGTPRYMSPEQAMGLNSQLTARSDLFSFGTICYEALTGKPMFDSEHVAQLLYQIAQVPHVPLLVALPELPQNVARAIENALVKEPSERTPDVATFVREFTGTQLGTFSTPKLVPDVPTRTQLPTRDEHLVPAAEGGGTVPLRGPQGVKAVERAPAPRMGVGTMAGIGVSLLLISGAVAFVVSQRMQHRDPVLVPSMPKSEVAKVIDAGSEPPSGGEAPEVVVEPAPVEAVVDAGVEQLAVVPTAAKEAKPRKTHAADAPMSEGDATFLAEITAMHDAQDWASLVRAQKSVQALEKKSGARKRSLLMVFEALCARHETGVISTFNRLMSDYPESYGQAVELCRKHLPDQELRAP